MSKCDKKRIRELRWKGRTYQSIAKEVGCSRQYVAQVCGKQEKTIPVRPVGLLSNNVKKIDARPLVVYLETNIKLLESTKHCYEVFDHRGDRYPIENIYKEILDIVNALTEVSE